MESQGILNAAFDPVNHALRVAVPSGTSVSWALQFSDPGNSLTPWSVAAGTWTADSVGIHHTDITAGTERLLRTTAYPSSASILQGDVRIPSAGQGVTTLQILAGFKFGPTPDASGGIAVKLQRLSGVSTIVVEDDALQTNLVFPYAWALDTWYTLRIVKNGDSVSVYANGTYQFSYQFSPTKGLENTATLVAFQCLVDFRNISFWSQGGLPA